MKIRMKYEKIKPLVRIDKWLCKNIGRKYTDFSMLYLSK